jgi:carboxylesterase type B
MTRFAPIFAAAALIAAPAMAGSYSAKPLAAPAATKIIGKDISWSCAAGSCQGSTDASRPLVLCQDLAKRAGRLESFVADGRALSADQLDKCNASAKGGTPKVLAHAN